MEVNKQVDIIKKEKIFCIAALALVPILIVFQYYRLNKYIYQFNLFKLYEPSKIHIIYDLVIGILIFYVYNNIYLKKYKFLNIAFNMLGVRFVFSGIQYLVRETNYEYKVVIACEVLILIIYFLIYIIGIRYYRLYRGNKIVIKNNKKEMPIISANDSIIPKKLRKILLSRHRYILVFIALLSFIIGGIIGFVLSR